MDMCCAICIQAALRNLRLGKDWSVDELSERSGRSKEEISALEYPRPITPESRQATLEDYERLQILGDILTAYDLTLRQFNNLVAETLPYTSTADSAMAEVSEILAGHNIKIPGLD